MEHHHVSTGKKVLVAGGVVLVGYLLYRHFYGTASAATSKPLPAPGPAPSPAMGGGTTSGPNASVVTSATEVTSPYTTVASGPTQYTVTTASTGAAGQLRVRNGPGVSYSLIGVFQHGDTVNATGVTTNNPTDGYTWVEVINPSTGQAWGWAASTYLSPVSGGGTTTAGMVGLIPMIKPRAYAWG